MAENRKNLFKSLFIILAVYLIANTIFWFLKEGGSTHNNFIDLNEISRINTVFLSYLGVSIKLAFSIALLVVFIENWKVELKYKSTYKIFNVLLSINILFYFVTIIASIVGPFRRYRFYSYFPQSGLSYLDELYFYFYYGSFDIFHTIYSVVYYLISYIEFIPIILVTFFLFKIENRLTIQKKVIGIVTILFTVESVFCKILTIISRIATVPIAGHIYQGIIDSQVFFWANWCALVFITYSAYRLYVREQVVNVEEEPVLDSYESPEENIIENLEVESTADRNSANELVKLPLQIFLMSKGQCFGTEKLLVIQKKLANVDPYRFAVISGADYKNPTTMLILSLLFGTLGIDRFMLGQTGLGVIKLLTAGGCGIWTLIDWFLIIGITKDSNFNKLMKL